MMQNLAGKKIKSYEFSELIGIGGFGAVYRAHQDVVEREVAVKIIWPAFANHPNFIRKFESEAQLVAGLEHPHIVPLYDYWREPDGAYLVMRLLRGGHLRSKMDGGGWDVAEVARLLDQIGAALALAHRFDVVHRDLKPENILLDEEGNAYLADFGIAQIVSETTKVQDEEFDAMGSPAYAAPEQMAGKDTSPQTDLYCLGVILYELLTGQHPFPQLAKLTQTEMMIMRTRERLPSVLQLRPDLPVAVDAVIQKTTAIDPSERYADASSLMRAFRGAVMMGQTNNGALAAIDDIIPNPYKGLSAFQETDAQNFFGREALIHRLVRRLTDDSEIARFLAVVGPSGSGKSSVVKAGMIPALRVGAIHGSDDWFFIDMVPGSQPFKELETALTGVAVNPPDDLLAMLREREEGLHDAIERVVPPDSEVFLFVDQFEEVFTLVENEDITSLFLGAINYAVKHPNSRLHVVVTIRADFYDRPLLRPQMSDLMRERTEVVVPLSSDELERAIVEPARRVGVMLEPGLVAAIVAELKAQPGALPLLQYSLSELFERRESNRITTKAYQKIGGVRGALARRADELYEQFNEDQREATRQLFLRLITLGEGTEDTRRRALLSEVTSFAGNEEQMRTVVDILVMARLLTNDRDPETRSPTVEVTHEAIIREWGRLRDWLDESRNDVRMQRTIASLSTEWMEMNQEPSFLLRGGRLEQAEQWAKHTSLRLTRDEQAYLDTSIGERERQIAEEQARQEREQQLEQRAVRNLRFLAAGLTVFTLIAIILSGFALQQSQVADEERDRAESNALVSQSLALESNARRVLNESDADLALALALEAYRLDDSSVQSRQTLAEVALAPGTRRLFEGHTAFVTSVDVNPAATMVVSGSTDFTVRLWEIESGEEILCPDGTTFGEHSGDVTSVSFSPDGNTIISAGFDFVSILWDVATCEEIARFRGPFSREPVRSAVFSPDGNTIALSSLISEGGEERGIVTLIDVASGEEIQRFLEHDGTALHASFTPDGHRIVSNSRDGEVIVWDALTLEVVTRFSSAESSIRAFALSPDGQTVATGAVDGTLILWDATTGVELERFRSVERELVSVVYHPNGEQLITGDVDGIIHVWDLALNDEIYTLEEHSDSVDTDGLDILGLAISDGGRFVISGSKDKTVRVWNIGTSGEINRAQPRDSRVTGLAMGEDIIYTAFVDGVVMRQSLGNNMANVIIAEFAEPVRSLALSDDESRLLLGLGTGLVQLVDAETGAVLMELTGHAEPVLAVEFSPNNDLALTAAANNLILWDLQTGEARMTMNNEAVGNIFSVAFTPDGRYALSGGAQTPTETTSADPEDGPVFLPGVILWDLQTGEEVRRFSNHDGTVYSLAASNDLVVAGTSEASIFLWDLETAEQLDRITEHTDAVWSLGFSRDGSFFMSGAADNQIILWDAETREELQRFQAQQTIYALAFNPDDSIAVSGEPDGTVRLWQIFNNQNLLTWATSNRYTRDLTCEERERFRVGGSC